jgi:hypothetical protein
MFLCPVNLGVQTRLDKIYATQFDGLETLVKSKIVSFRQWNKSNKTSFFVVSRTNAVRVIVLFATIVCFDTVKTTL